ncbi:MAG: hypothetical protein JXA78_05635 [Anaerolineales bacterium]|nr:hypothetical protein [Anaerolineales bacterium]
MNGHALPSSANALLWRWLLLGILLLALAARLAPGPRTIDDSYITYRYAYNILNGNGFVYNPGERVLGTTTPLYTFLMVSASLFTGGAEAPFPALALAINALADGITCLLLYDLGRRLGYPYAGAGAALVWAIAPFSVTFAIGGLETSVYVLLLTAMIHIHLRARHILAAFLAALALLTRPDALILIGLLGLDRLWQITRDRGKRSENEAPTEQTQRGRTQRFASGRTQRFAPTIFIEALAFLLPTLAWIVFATIYFGSPLPHSITAKSLAYLLPPEAGFVRLLQHYATPFLEHMTFGIPWIGVGMVLYTFLYLSGALHAFRTRPHIWPFLAYPWLYLFTFALANPLIFRWYLTPPLPAYILTILIGAERLIDEIADRLVKRKHDEAGNDGQSGHARQARQARGYALLLFVILAPTLLSLRDWRLHPDHGLARPAPDMAWYQLELLYRQAAEALIPEMNRSAQKPSLAAGDVGVLGFYTQARILDTVGLNSPQSTQYYPLDPDFYVINYAIPPDLILDTLPDYIVILEVYGRAGLLKDQRFWQNYELRQKIPTDIYGSDGMLIFERKG